MAHSYLSWDKKTTSDFSPENINSLYNQGFVFVRTGRGMMEQTRSLRIDLAKFKLSSENKRILKKTEGLELIATSLPYSEYHWSIGKLAKDFYTKKFGDGTFSANKVKELLTDVEKSNFNLLLQYMTLSLVNSRLKLRKIYDIKGYCISYETSEFLHYCYPFYNPELNIVNLGMGMMLKAILYAHGKGKKYIYLGSFQRPTDVYKLQFEGLEWWDGKGWKNNLVELKKTL